ncbi:fibronectin type III domain-containing protein [Thermodesulfobacteriota bacterium]
MPARKSTPATPAHLEAYLPAILGLLLFGACSLSDPAGLISAGEEALEVGWILTDDDPDAIDRDLSLAPSYNVSHIQLSHSLIMDIDEILEDPAKAVLINDTAARAHDLGIHTYIWAHELNTESFFACFDPAEGSGSTLDVRRQVYRDALAVVPDVDGVVLMFGSSNLEPWYAACFCPYCLFSEPLFTPLTSPHPVDRLDLIMRAVGQAVVSEMGRELIIRTFIHQPWELEWVGEALRNLTGLDLTVMCKEVPQDWEPNYPHNPLIGNAGSHGQIVEFDLTGEYWGQARIPFCMPAYLQYRIQHQVRQGIAGAAGRTNRYSNHPFGTPNEVNVYAFTKLLEDPRADVDGIWAEWIESRYGLTPGSGASETLAELLARTFDIGRKMYYIKGFWALEKGSGLPDHGRYPELLGERSIGRWDPDYKPLERELRCPTEQTLKDIFQEKSEAVEMCARSRDDLEMIREELDPQDYVDIKNRLEHQLRCTEIWRWVADAVWRYKYWRQRLCPKHARYLGGTLERLEALADEMEAVYGPDISPGNPGRIRDIVEDTRKGFHASPPPELWTQPLISGVESEASGPGTVRITWRTDVPATSQVEYGLEVPDYGDLTVLDETLTGDHSVTIEGLEPGEFYVFRIHSRISGGEPLVSGDYRVLTRQDLP